MSLITIVIGLVVIGLLLWVVSQLDFIDPTIKKIIRVVIVVVVVLWLLQGLFGGVDFPSIRVR